MTIKKLTQNDVTSYRRLRLQSLQTDPDAFFLQYDQAKDYPDAFFVSELASNDEKLGFYGAIVDEELIGMVSVRRVDLHTFQLFTLYVAPTHRGHGIGRRLLLHALHGIPSGKTARLTVISGNPAISLYVSLGFVRVGEHPNALTTIHGTFDELVFQRIV